MTIDWSIRCPSCGELGRVERDWRGDEVISCAAYRPCRPTLERLMAREWAAREARMELFEEGT